MVVSLYESPEERAGGAMKAIWIRADQQTVEMVDYAGVRDLGRLVGGYLELAHQWKDSGDVLYVDEDGERHLRGNGGWGFRIIERTDQWLCGNGVIVGAEIGDTAGTAPPRQTPLQVLAKVMWGRAED